MIDNSRAATRISSWPKWLFLAVVAVMLVLGVVLTRSAQRSKRIARIAEEICVAGGDVRIAPPEWQLMWWRFRRDYASLAQAGDTVVRLPMGIDGEWIRANHYLTDIRIESLEVCDAPALGGELAVLVQRHPVCWLTAPDARCADDIASGLCSSHDHQVVNLAASDLTDKGLKQLPLEHISELNVSSTRVSIACMAELKRCQQLTSLVLDGRQFTATGLLELVADCPQLTNIDLVDCESTETRLREIAAEKVRCQDAQVAGRELMIWSNDATLPESVLSELNKLVKPWIIWP